MLSRFFSGTSAFLTLRRPTVLGDDGYRLYPIRLFSKQLYVYRFGASAPVDFSSYLIHTYPLLSSPNNCKSFILPYFSPAPRNNSIIPSSSNFQIIPFKTTLHASSLNCSSLNEIWYNFGGNSFSLVLYCSK